MLCLNSQLLVIGSPYLTLSVIKKSIIEKFQSRFALYIMRNQSGTGGYKLSI